MRTAFATRVRAKADEERRVLIFQPGKLASFSRLMLERHLIVVVVCVLPSFLRRAGCSDQTFRSVGYPATPFVLAVPSPSYKN